MSKIKLKVEVGTTINMGNYESAKVGVGIERMCEEGDEDLTYKEMLEWANEKLDEEELPIPSNSLSEPDEFSLPEALADTEPLTSPALDTVASEFANALIEALTVPVSPTTTVASLPVLVLVDSREKVLAPVAPSNVLSCSTVLAEPLEFAVTKSALVGSPTVPSTDTCAPE